MASTRVTLMKSALKTMHALNIHSMMRPLSEGLGMILTLHRVRPAVELDAELGAYQTSTPMACSKSRLISLMRPWRR
jgi:hypothetical protein